MIIKKRNFNLTPGYRKKWPFTVPEVTVQMWTAGNEKCFLLVHNFGGFALSGVLEGHGFDPLEKSGIWADETSGINGNWPGEPAIKKSLTPFSEYVQKLADREGLKNDG